MTTRIPEKLTTLPDVPKEFGDDGGKFYRYYDELADELDEDLVKSLKAQLDGILIFAGLFAGVNSAFLAFTLPQMSADPADDTNALLLQILLGGNSSITSAADLPSASFTPPPRIYPINVLFSVSLTLALLSSFLAVLGQQWIVYYRKRSGGGPEHQRWEQLRRTLGAKRWRLELVLDDLVPSILILGLVIFCIAFSLYLGTLSKSLSFIIAAILCAALIVILAMTTCAAFDPWCPFKTSLSRSILPIVCFPFPFVSYCFLAILVVLVFVPLWILERILMWENTEFTGKLIGESLDEAGITCNDLYKALIELATRSADDPEYLQVEAIRKVICVSEDRAALVHAAMNLQTIRNHGHLLSLVEDDVFYSRMFGLRGSYQVQSQRPHNTELIEARALSASFFHIWLSAGSFSDIVDLLDLHPTTDSHEQARAEAFATIRSLCQRTLIPFTADCDRYLHCTTLSFSMRVVEGALTKSADLRLGCVVARAILCSRMPRYPHSVEQGLGQVILRSDPFEELAMAYRARDGSQMIEVVGRALATVEFKWEGQPDHELYIRLFELGLSSGIGLPGSRPILEQLGTLLLSIENRIRDQATSGRDGQRGREHQNRCVQSVGEYFKQTGCGYSEIWNYIGSSVELYMEGVKTQVETDPASPKNPPTIGLLRRIKSSFPEPGSGSGPTPDTPDINRHSKFCELLDQIEMMCQTRSNVISEQSVVQLTRVLSDDTDAVESTGTRNTDKKDVSLHASPSLWGN